MTSRLFIFVACAAGLLLPLGLSSNLEGADKSKPVDFDHDIRPILSKRCFSCHGAEQAEASLRLDRKVDALKGGNGGPILTPGKSGDSRLVSYITGQNDDDMVMPPEGERLSTTEVALIKHWIDQGAPWPEEPKSGQRGSDHWSFQPIRQVAVPKVRHADRVRNPIDAFVLAKLEKLGVEPSPEADRATLIRRLSLDLLGLPPKPEEVDEFVHDESPEAYEKLVDRLLASPHYGERFARHWLDLARYADSDGYEKDTGRPYAWRYRHWVIDALNRDLPFDEFTIEQLAGDLLPKPTTEQLVATGFHRNTLINREGGVDQEEYRVAATIDRVNTTGAVWLGLTVGCAQCHTHKYDPIAQREYYGMFAFFNGLTDRNVPAPLADELARYETAKKAFDAAHAPFVAALAKFETEEQPKLQAAWEQARAADRQTAWSLLALDEATGRSRGEVKFTPQPDGSLLVTSGELVSTLYTLAMRTSLERVSALRLETLADQNLPGQGPGRAKDGSFSLTGLTVTAQPLDPKHPEAKQPARKVAVQNPRADIATAALAAVFDGDPKTGWKVNTQLGRDHVALFELVDPPSFVGGTKLSIVLDQRAGDSLTIGRFRLSATAAATPVGTPGIANEVETALLTPAGKRTPAQQTQLTAYYRTQNATWQQLNRAVQTHLAKAPADPRTTNLAQALAELPGGRQTHIFSRGDFLRPGAEVQPHTLEILPPLKARGAQPDRLDLARWLVDPANPLTARVTANRFWALHFGRGLVPTVEDFGTQGEKPSHPELLDWLAGQFVRDGWSMKRLHKLIVTSGTYRQSSRTRRDLAERDPTNLWLARQRRLRVEAEVIRDLSLSASGLMCERVGGQSVRPRQPAGISELTYAGVAKWVESSGDDRHRRGLYTWFQRTSPYPMLMTFDAPDSNVVCTRRERSNTPLQALTLLNDPVFFECAQSLGRRIIAETPRLSQGNRSLNERLRYAFRVCLAREPSAAERATLEELYTSQIGLCRADPKAAKELIGEGAVPRGATAEELAAWIAVGRTLMNLDEFISRE